MHIMLYSAGAWFSSSSNYSSYPSFP